MKFAFLSTVALSVMLQVAPAMADEGDIIVTARKRQESILNVPVITSVVTQDALEKAGNI